MSGKMKEEEKAILIGYQIFVQQQRRPSIDQPDKPIAVKICWIILFAEEIKCIRIITVGNRKAAKR